MLEAEGLKGSRENKDSAGKSFQQIITPKDQVQAAFHSFHMMIFSVPLFAARHPSHSVISPAVNIGQN